MTWLLLALSSAFFWGIADVLSKKILRDDPPAKAAWVRWGYALFFLWPAFWLFPRPSLDGVFWKTLIWLVPLEIGALLLYMKALHLSPVSLVTPLLALTPAATIGTGVLILNEKVSFWGMAGLLVIVLGAYLLNVHLASLSFWDPLRSLLGQSGPRAMLLVALIYGLTSVLGKKAMLHSGIFFFSFIYPLTVGLTLLFYLLVTRSLNPRQILEAKPAYWLLGAVMAAMTLCHFGALALIETSYMIAVKRTSILFSAFFGGILFHEERLGQRLLAALLMVAGVFVLALT